MCCGRQRLCQAGSGIQGRSSRIMALSATRSLRATAISATCFGLPTASRRARKAARWGSQRTAARAARYNAFRTRGRPAAILRRPRNCPLSRASGARPANAAACRALSCPNSGRSASKAQQVLGPMPGAVRSCVARWHAAGCSRSACSTCCSSSAISWLNEAITRSALAKTVAPCSCHWRVRCWARRPTSASRWRSNSRRSRNCRLGKRVAAGRSRSPNSANTRASSRSVFASSPNDASEVAHAFGVHHGHSQPGGFERRPHRRLQSTSGFQDH